MDAHLLVLGTYPVDIQKLKEHLMYENELYYTLRTRITERDHFAAIISHIERYFKGALGASTRSKIVKMIQNIIDDHATSVEEARRLKHILDVIRNASTAGIKGYDPNPMYIDQLSSAYTNFLQDFG